MLHYLIYTSKSNLHSHKELDDILRVAKFYNEKNDITGVLLYDEFHFLQVLEGNKQSIDNTYSFIKNDKRHKDILLKTRGTIQRRNFELWSMRICLTEKNDLLELHNLENLDEKNIYGDEDFLKKLIVLSYDVFSEYKTHSDQHPDLQILSKLTASELTVLKLLVKGNSAKDIGRILNISHKTAANHTDNIKKKLNCHDKNNLIKEIFESGYIKYFI